MRHTRIIVTHHGGPDMIVLDPSDPLQEKKEITDHETGNHL